MTGLAEAFDRIGSFLEERLPLMHAAGAAVAVTDRDEILGVAVRGFADAASGTPVRPDTRFQIGSISKSFAAIVAVQEAAAGRLDLHAPVSELLPWVEIPQPFGPITPHHLLTHTSGLPTGTEDAPGELAAVWNLREAIPGFAPGERFWYSNDAYKLLGLILEHRTGQRIPELIRERVLGPLGMRHTSPAITNDVRTDLATGYATMYDDRPPNREHPLVPAVWIVSDSADGSIVSSVVDMTAYARMLLSGGVPVLQPSGFDVLTTPASEGGDPDAPEFGYAYGLYVGLQDGRRRLFHTGGMIGFTALLMVDPDDGLGVVMLLNGSGARRPTGRFALACVRRALAGQDLPEVEHHDPAVVVNAADFAGTYAGEGRAFEVVALDEQLLLREGETEAALEPDAVEGDPPGDVFLALHPALDRFRVSFGRDGAGRVAEAFHGADRLVREGAAAQPPPAQPPPEWHGFTGAYRSNDPWYPFFRVVLRSGQLWMLAGAADEPELPLVPLGDGTFRVGRESWRPERIRFDRVVDGKTIRAVYDRGSWYRSFEE
ncbi:MAG TPA: serine hydrolase domain-containing protein [Actinomycetota bacterium]